MEKAGWIGENWIMNEKGLNRRLCVAPMMDWTDRHCRYFHRLLAPGALLYTEMVTTGAVVHGDRERLLGYNPEEHPVALQLGGSDPDDLARSARVGEEFGYDEINLNVGCPSDRVQKGRFGACLMLEPGLVRDCMRAMIEAVTIPVTFKCRLGVDEHYSYGYFRDFVGAVTESGTTTVIAHARKAWLSGLSPRQNREVPELQYAWVYRLKQELPELEVVINGGIDDLAAVRQQLERVDGVMLGRAAYHDPWLLAECQRDLGEPAPANRDAVVEAFSAYLASQVGQGVPVKHMTRHVLGLFQGQPGARKWRRYISENAHRDDRNDRILFQALEAARGVVPG
jgi:tRNA-dihydrouridine synthase A